MQPRLKFLFYARYIETNPVIIAEEGVAEFKNEEM